MEIDMRESRISSARSTLAKASVVACLAVMTAAPAWAADSGSASEGRGFAGLLEMFNIFASHHDAKAPPAAAPGDKAPDGARVRLSSNGAGSTKLGIEIPLDDPGSGGKGKGAFIYLESGTDIVDPADLDRRLPKTIGEASPGSPTDALATRASAPVSGRPIASALQNSLPEGSFWSFTPRYAAVHFGISYLPEKSSDPNHQGLEFGVTSTFLRRDRSYGLDSLFIDAPLLGSNRQIYNLGFNLGYSGVTFGASLQRDSADALGAQTAYDVGVNYRRGAFSTSLQFSSGRHKRARNMLFRVNPDNRIYAFEFGAAYRLRPGVSLGGGLQYFNYNSVTLSQDSNDAAVVYLGGNVNF